MHKHYLHIILFIYVFSSFFIFDYLVILFIGGDEPSFWANLLFGNAQSGSERTSFSGSTVKAREGKAGKPFAFPTS